MAPFKARKIVSGENIYRGWQISKMETGRWNCGPEGEFFTDSHLTMQACKTMIDRFIESDHWRVKKNK